MQPKKSNARRSLETRTRLLAEARALFLEKGYAATGTPELVQRAGLTRGALYHHYQDKLAVFRGVVQQEAAQVSQHIDQASSTAKTPLDALLVGAQAYFAAMREPGRVRLLLLDGPAVLGPEEMHRIDLETGGLELRQGLQAALGERLDAARINALADLISAVFDRAALATVNQADTGVYEQEVTRLLRVLVGVED